MNALSEYGVNYMEKIHLVTFMRKYFIQLTFLCICIIFFGDVLSDEVLDNLFGIFLQEWT